MMRVGMALAACALLAGCGGWWGSDDKAKLPGTRVAILSNEASDVVADPSLVGVPVSLPVPVSADWPQPGGSATHHIGQAALGTDIRNAWSIGVGDGSTGQRRILAQPVVAGGFVYTVDAGHEVTALDPESGRRIWSVELKPEYGGNSSSAGGIAYDNGRLYVGTGFAEVIALDAKSGSELWRERVSGPVRSSPAVAGGQVYVVSIDNYIHALSVDGGELMWSQAGLAEAASLLGGAVPAVSGEVVLAPFSSGELYAVQAASGTPLWVETVGMPLFTEALGVLNNIAGNPVVDRDRVYVAGHNNLVMALDLGTGERIWEQSIGATQSPWVAGDTLFMTSTESQLVALDLASGKVRWATPLRQWEYESDQMGRIVWTAPVLAGGRLYLANARKELLIVDPQNGQILGQQSLPDPVSLPPVVANGTLYILTDDARLMAFR